MRVFFLTRYRRIEKIKSRSENLQEDMFMSLIKRGKGTEYGKKYHFSTIQNYEQFKELVPLTDYESLKPYIERMMEGESHVLWPGLVTQYAKSSGTTDRSKYIPMTSDCKINNHLRAGYDTTTILYQNDPDCAIFHKKSLIMGGSLNRHDQNHDVTVGDVSALLIEGLPKYSHSFYTPDFDIALHHDWEEKIERMAHQCMKEDIVMFGGVPTWTIVLFDRILEISGAANMEEIWPHAAYYMHGGVGFDPYRVQFDRYFPSKKLKYFEAYNASEGYFAIADRPDVEGMLLLTDNDVFYEFIDMADFSRGEMNTITLADVKPGVNYAIIISTSAGLWRYMIGDTVTFTSVNPYRLKVTGRTKHYINVFGEEVMVGNTEDALSQTIDREPAIVANYTVGPTYMEQKGKGSHHWVIEFSEAPRDIKRFTELLDQNLQAVNSDYAAKRSHDLALEEIRLDSVKEGTFHEWLKQKGKVGGQNKVPRLFNDRTYVDELLDIHQRLQ